MGMTYEMLKNKIKSEGKFSLDQIEWILNKIESLEKQIDKLEVDLGERVNKLERAQDDHIPGGI